jgi:endo-1,4-beta-xylanase
MRKQSRLIVLASFGLAAAGVGCSNDSPPAPKPDDTAVAAALVSIQSDFEDGSTQGWFPFGSPTLTNSTDVANTGTHSLKITNRTSGFMGPGISLTGQLSPATTYRVSVATRLVAGQAATGL